MKRKSPDIRAVAINAVLEKKLSIQDAITIFHVSKSSLYRWIKIYKDEGRLVHKTPPGRPPIITQEIMQQINDILARQPDITLAELADKLDNIVSVATLHVVLKNAGYVYKKNSQGIGTKSGRYKNGKKRMERDAEDTANASYRLH